MTESKSDPKESIDEPKFECNYMESATENKDGKVIQYIRCSLYSLNVTDKSFCKEKLRMQNPPKF